jgi:16S rRNA (guanine527-N7)-methyltransferase
MKPTATLIRDAAEATAVELNEKQLEQIALFCELLRQYNQHTNLVGNAEVEVVVRDHILDTFTLVPIIQRYRGSGQSRLIDIGSGAGFPGLILALVIEDLRVTLVEAIAKKTKFLTEVSSRLNLDKMLEVKNTRAEDLAHHGQYRGQFDFACARAVGSLAIVCELSAPFLKRNGLALIQKSMKQWKEDEAQARKHLGKIGASIKETILLNPEISGKELVVIVIEQTDPAPARYPRPWTQIKKSPLF